MSKSVFSIGKEAFLPLLMMLTQGRMPGAGMIPGMVPPRMMPGQVPQPQPQVQPSHTVPRPRPRPRPQPADNDMEMAARLQEERFRQREQMYNTAAPASNDEFGYGRPHTVAPQQQQQTQVVSNNSGTMRQYSVQDFANMDLNTLENLKIKGQNSRASIDSFNSALQAAIAQKRLAVRQSPEPIMQYEPPQEEQPIVSESTTTTTTQTTTDTITTDAQTAADLREATTDNEDLQRPQEEQSTAGDIAE